MPHLIVRDFRPEDAAAVAQVFFDAVHLGTGGLYTPAQKTAWAGDAPRPDSWRARLRGVTCKLAVQEGKVVGFMSLDETGLIDVAFTAPRVAGTGVGWRLYGVIETRARQQGLCGLRTEASLSARPFFTRQGWKVDAEQGVHRGGETLTNFRMSKQLAA